MNTVLRHQYFNFLKRWHKCYWITSQPLIPSYFQKTTKKKESTATGKEYKIDVSWRFVLIILFMEKLIFFKSRDEKLIPAELWRHFIKTQSSINAVIFDNSSTTVISYKLYGLGTASKLVSFKINLSNFLSKLVLFEFVEQAGAELVKAQFKLGLGLTLFYPGGGALSAIVFGDRLLLLNSFTYCIDTSWLWS